MLKLLAQFFNFLIGTVFDIDQFVTRLIQSTDQFIELEVHGFRVAVLRVLNQEHHQEGNNRGTRVNH